MSRLTFSSVLLSIVMAAGCSTPPPAPPKLAEMESPAHMFSEEPNVSGASDGRVFMSWLEPASSGGNTMFFSVRDTKGMWSEPHMVASGDDWFVNDADFPSMTAMADGSLAAHWLGNNEAGEEAYDVNVSFSHDGGATWSKPVTPHRDGTSTQHGFVSLIPSADGKLNAIWLDGRKTHEDGTGDMALMHTTIGMDGSLGAETVLDDRVCDCCQTSAAMTPNGLLVVYRDRTDKEIRDISMVRFNNGTWSQPEPLSKDGWEITACPVNGPAISSNGQNVAAAWFTDAQDQAHVNVVRSTDGGKTFGAPIRVDEGKPLGRVDVVTLPSGASVVTWLETTAQGTQLHLRVIDTKGAAGAPMVVSGSTGVRSGGFARMAASGNQVVIAWTDAGETPRVRTALLSF